MSEITERTLKFGWTYTSLENYKNGDAEQLYVLDADGSDWPRRQATDTELTLLQWLNAGTQLTQVWRNGDLEISTEVVEASHHYPETELAQMIADNAMLSTVTIEFQDLGNMNR